jgi:hypothetical protein
VGIQLFGGSNLQHAFFARGYNPTVYRHGYLYFADSLCFRERELEQVRALVMGRPANPPGCFLLS